MTAFSLVMLGKLVFLAVFVCFFAVVAVLRPHKHLFAARKNFQKASSHFCFRFFNSKEFYHS